MLHDRQAANQFEHIHATTLTHGIWKIMHIYKGNTYEKLAVLHLGNNYGFDQRFAKFCRKKVNGLGRYYY